MQFEATLKIPKNLHSKFQVHSYRKSKFILISILKNQLEKVNNQMFEKYTKKIFFVSNFLRVDSLTTCWVALSANNFSNTKKLMWNTKTLWKYSHGKTFFFLHTIITSHRRKLNFHERRIHQFCLDTLLAIFYRFFQSSKKQKLRKRKNGKIFIFLD